MATSRTALTLFFPSITCPPFSSRSYSCAAADELSIRIKLKQNGALMEKSFYSNAILFKLPGGSDNVAQQNVARFPTQTSLQLTGVGDQRGRISGPARADRVRYFLTRDLLDRPDYFEQALAGAGPDIEAVRRSIADQRLERRDVGFGQVHHMNVIAD